MAVVVIVFFSRSAHSNFSSSDPTGTGPFSIEGAFRNLGFVLATSSATSDKYKVTQDGFRSGW
jgi:hypothetical protein